MTIPTGMRAWLVGGGIVAVLVFAVVATFNHQGQALSDARRALEASDLDRLGLIRAHEKTVSELNAKLASLAAADPQFGATIAEAKAAVPDSKLVQVGVLSTGTIKAHGTPREDPTQAPSAPAPQATASAETPPAVPAPGCLLAEGDPGSIEVKEVTLQTSAGNLVFAGVGYAYREGPGPRALILGGPFKANVSDVSGLPPPSLPRWGYGFAAACLGFCAAGPAVAIPPFHIFRVQIETTVAGLVSDRGAGGAAFFIGRF